MLLFKCVVAAQLILDVCIVGIQLRSSELQIVCSYVSLYLRTLGSGTNIREKNRKELKKGNSTRKHTFSFLDLR